MKGVWGRSKFNLLSLSGCEGLVRTLIANGCRGCDRVSWLSALFRLTLDGLPQLDAVDVLEHEHRLDDFAELFQATVERMLKRKDRVPIFDLGPCEIQRSDNQVRRACQEPSLGGESYDGFGTFV